jgi:hypothetical protein
VYPLPRLLTTAALLGLICARPACATTFDPIPFEKLVLDADFVGIVECETAGGIVATYKIVESWRGAKAGGQMSIALAVNFWGGQFPETLCGQRYLVTAFKNPPSNILTTSSGGGVPLWWRDIPADYRLPFLQGRQLLSPGYEKSAEFEKKRKEVQGLLALKPAERELTLLRAYVNKYLFGDGRRTGGEPDKAKEKELRNKLGEINSADALVAELLRLTEAEPGKWAGRVYAALREAGGPIALARLEKFPAEKSPWGKEGVEELVKAVKRNGGLIKEEKPEEEPRRPEGKPPTEAELKELRAVLARGTKHDDFWDAFTTLTLHDPGPVAAFLAALVIPKDAFKGERNQGYVLGSYFAWRCGKDREVHLKTLLGAKDPFVRVCGAVYLCYENEERGMAALRKVASLEGTPGAWAAVTLARRGDKEAVPRALEVCREEEDLEALNLRNQLLILLSNSARAGGAPQPEPPRREKEEFDYLTRWWKENKDKLALRDPWLKLLEKQKID